MRLVIQRVAQASVTCAVAGQATVTRSIDRGMMVLVGFEKNDTGADMDAMLKQLVKLRIFAAVRPPSSGAEDKNEGKKRAALVAIGDAGVDMLLVSQFTLSAELKSGRPSFHPAMPADQAKTMFEEFVCKCRGGLPGECAVESGVFGSYMQVHLVNDGPYTICMSARDGKCESW